MEQESKTTARGWQTCVLAVLFVASTGCVKFKSSDPKRTATEQLLLSTAADHAIKNIDVSKRKTSQAE